MHHGEERVTGQFGRRKEKKRKEEQTHKKLEAIDTDGGKHRVGATFFQIRIDRIR